MLKDSYCTVMIDILDSRFIMEVPRVEDGVGWVVDQISMLFAFRNYSKAILLTPAIKVRQIANISYAIGDLRSIVHRC